MREKVLYALGIAAILLMAYNLRAIAALPLDPPLGPAAIIMPPVAKLVFFYYAAGGVAIAAGIASAIAGLRFLRTRDFRYDALAVASTEVGLVFLAIHIVTGCLGTRTVYGPSWAWEPRLTTALACGLLYATYLMLRSAVEEPAQRARFAAVWSVFIFLNLPMLAVAINWWRANNRRTLFWRGGSDYIAAWLPSILGTMLAMILLGVLLTAVRMRQEETRRELDTLRRMTHAL
jgi:heme exporter protein C